MTTGESTIGIIGRERDQDGSGNLANILAIIVTYNSSSQIVGCLRALDKARMANIVVWDNDSSDDTVEQVRKRFQRVRISLSDRNIGFGSAVNHAAAAGAEEYLLFINPDCIAPKRTLERLKQLLDENPDVGAVSPGMEYLDGRRGIAAGGKPSVAKELTAILNIDRIVSPAATERMLASLRIRVPRITEYMHSRQPGPPIDVHWVSGFCMMVRRSAWEEVSGFDEDFFMYFEDVDLCERLKDRGWRSVCARDVIAVHDESSSSKHHGKNSMYRASMVKYFKLHGGRIERLAAMTLLRLF